MAKTPFDAERGQGTISLDPEDVLIIEDRKHRRFDRRIDKPLTDEFLASLAKRQLEPGIVFRNEEGKCEIANGRRRLRGLRELNKRRAKGTERYMFTAVYLKIAGNENMDEVVNAVRHEANLHEGDSLSEKAQAADEHMNMTRFGWSAERTGVLFGVGPKTIEKWRTIVECAAPVLAALDSNRIGLGAAVELAALPKKDQVARLEAIQEGRAPVRAEGGGKAKGNASPKLGRPSTAEVRDVARRAAASSGVSEQTKAALGWAAGTVTLDELLAAVPALAVAGAKQKAAA